MCSHVNHCSSERLSGQRMKAVSFLALFVKDSVSAASLPHNWLGLHRMGEGKTPPQQGDSHGHSSGTGKEGSLVSIPDPLYHRDSAHVITLANSLTLWMTSCEIWGK